MNAVTRSVKSAVSRLRHRVDLARLRHANCGAAKAVAQAIESAHNSDAGDGRSPWIARIEAIREELLATHDELDSWSRPWLTRSAELQSRLNVNGANEGTFATKLSVCDAVKASKDIDACRLLYSLVRSVKPSTVIELGTNVGISGSYIGAALADNGLGRLLTLEGSASKAALAGANFERLGLQRCEVVVGDFFDTLKPLLDEIDCVDLAFIDGFHDGDATIAFHRQLHATVAGTAVFVYDDIGWSSGMRRAWSTLRAFPEVIASIEQNGMGVCVVRGCP